MCERYCIGRLEALKKGRLNPGDPPDRFRLHFPYSREASFKAALNPRIALCINPFYLSLIGRVLLDALAQNQIWMIRLNNVLIECWYFVQVSFPFPKFALGKIICGGCCTVINDTKHMFRASDGLKASLTNSHLSTYNNWYSSEKYSVPPKTYPANTRFGSF